MTAAARDAGPVLHLEPGPASVSSLARDVFRHRHVLAAMARADFQVRYKRAAFGVAWAVLVPLAQAAVLAVVFSRFIRMGDDASFGAYVLGGVVAWGYFALTLGVAGTAIVDGSGLTDKVWFPRAILPLVPCLANTVGLAVSLAAVVALSPLVGGDVSWRLALVVPASVLLVAFTASLALVLSALHVYFRDVRFIVQAALMVWFYATPILYPITLVGRLRPVLELNPMTGIVGLFHLATVGTEPHWERQLLVSVAVTIALAVVAVEVYRRHDRIFVDQL